MPDDDRGFRSRLPVGEALAYIAVGVLVLAVLTAAVLLAVGRLEALQGRPDVSDVPAVEDDTDAADVPAELP